MTPAELPGYLREIRARVAAAEVPVAQKMGEAYKEHLVGWTLHESGSHAPMEKFGDKWTPAPEGRPPAFMPGGLNGSLAGSVTQGPTEGGDGWGRTSVSPHTIYAATQEWGGVHTGHMVMWIGYVGYQRAKEAGWLRRKVVIPERPYMRTAVTEMVANGQLTRVAADTFEVTVWG